MEINLVLMLISAIILISTSIMNINSEAVQLSKFIQLATPSSFILSFYLHLTVVYYYLCNFNWCSAFNANSLVEIDTPLVYLQSGSISLDFFAIVLITLAYLVGFISLVSINDNVFWTNSKYPVIFNFFIIVVTLFVTCDHLFMFFLYYEFLLIPSFLIVYYSSSNQKGIQASIYFLIWTQSGSTIVLSLIVTFMNVGEINYFSDINTLSVENDLISNANFLIFLGFGFKIPIWPLYYWLTNTHVEATGAFSMYLSGFLVKTALYGLYNFLIAIDWTGTNILFFAISVTGVVMSSLQMWAQVDLNNIVALCTVQEMNLLLICFIFGQSPIVYFGILFCFMHAILSTLMFFLVDSIQNSFGTRLTTELSGIIHICPNLGAAIVIMCLCFLAVPFTLNFTCEFAMFAGIIDLSFFMFMIIAICTNWLAPLSFCSSWYGVTFSSPNSKYFKVLDLDSNDIIIISLCVVLLTVTCTFSMGIM